ncbi:hypothetical protein Q3V23_02630 [Streptomyces sp. VNUA116]|uniref:hypothetical protein n=1 Tax=Streptomyces sp. VNUA116 TaxID=3062449 RepID=UPI002675EE13|nr:hypothetical protein [Streptomyces sp. VNUA116]WKU43055.1 hypothetical protein Q3V23_02630 [Streptomyces sp. VNUA116]
MTTTDFGAVHNSALELTDRLRKTDAYPLFPVVAQAGPTRARVRAAGCATERDVTVLASADYLGLAHHPEVRERAADALRRFGTGTYGSQAAGGFMALDEELERTVAAWPDRPAALLFPSGLQADLGVLGTLAGPGGAARPSSWGRSTGSTWSPGPSASPSPPPADTPARTNAWWTCCGTPLFPPAVPIGGARLRLGVTAAHSEAELQRAVQMIAAAVEEEQ